MSDDIWPDWALGDEEEDLAFNEYREQKLASEKIESGEYDDDCDDL